MSRLAAAHRALTQLYDQQAEATVDHLLATAACLCLASSRRFFYVDAMGGHWIMLEIWQPELLAFQRWMEIVE